MKNTGGLVSPINTGGDQSIHDTKDVKRMMWVTRNDAGKYFVHINSSSLDTIQTCPKKAYYALHRGLVSKEPGLATTFGKGVHKALEVMYATPREQRVLPPNYKEKILMMCQGQTLDDEASNFTYQAVRGFIDVAGEALANLPQEDKRSLVNGAYLLGEYFERRINDPYEVVVIDGEPLVEKTLSWGIWDDDKLNITLFGTMDAVMENKANKQVVVCDHKTTSVTNMNDFYNRTKPNHQYTGYIHLAQQCLGINTENFMINIFQVKPRPKTSRGKGPDFMHIITKRTPQDVMDMIKTVHYFVTQYIYWLETAYWPYGTPNACANYGKCMFLDVCQSPENIKESILSANYEVRG